MRCPTLTFGSWVMHRAAALGHNSIYIYYNIVTDRNLEYRSGNATKVPV